MCALLELSRSVKLAPARLAEIFLISASKPSWLYRNTRIRINRIKSGKITGIKKNMNQARMIRLMIVTTSFKLHKFIILLI